MVAYADYETDQLSWFGWPEGLAKISDCELVEACSDEEHKHLVGQWLKEPVHGSDHRPAMVRRLYAHVIDES